MLAVDPLNGNQELFYRNVIESIKDQVPGKSYNSILCTTRIKLMIEDFLFVLSKILSRQFEKEICLRRIADSALNSWEVSQGNYVSIHLKVFSDNLIILLPFELVHELSALVRKQQPSTILTTPEKEELTAISYCVVKILAQAQLFSKQRIYLTSVNLQLNNLDQDKLKLGLEFVVNQSNYLLPVLLTKGLAQRISHYAGHRIYRATTLDRLKFVKTTWRLMLSSTVNSIQELLALKSGDILKINRSRSTYKLEEKNNKNLAINLELITDNQLGCFKLRLITN